jgi:hypothetical protein
VLAKAAADLNIPIPSYPTINRRPLTHKLRSSEPLLAEAERALEASFKALAEAERVLHRAREATDSVPRTA